MLTDRHFPYSSMQEINLDWILTKVKNILRFVPDDGAVGQILRRTAHGAEWSDEQGAGGSVTSVNGMQGAVVLTAPDVGALPDTYAAPVDSVNGQTGPVVLSIPSDTADLTNTAGFVTAAGAAAAAPVQSVNGQTGAVVISSNNEFQTGDTIEFNDTYFSGWSDTSGQYLIAMFVTDKDIPNTLTITHNLSAVSSFVNNVQQTVTGFAYVIRRSKNSILIMESISGAVSPRVPALMQITGSITFS